MADSTVSKADVPNRFAASIAYEGIPGSSIAAHVARETWSSLNGLGSSAAEAVDTWESGLGVEALGPRLIGRQTLLRIGARRGAKPGSFPSPVAWGLSSSATARRLT